MKVYYTEQIAERMITFPDTVKNAIHNAMMSENKKHIGIFVAIEIDECGSAWICTRGEWLNAKFRHSYKDVWI